MIEFNGHDVLSVLLEVAGLYGIGLAWISRRLRKMATEITNVKYILVGARESREQSVLARLTRIENTVAPHYPRGGSNDR